MLSKLLSRPAAPAPEVPPAARGPLDFMRLVMHYNLQPQAGLHPSWLPPDWPLRYRRLAGFGPAGQAVLGDLLAEPGSAPDYRFDSQVKRLALLESGAQRRLAVYVGLAAHAPLLRQRSQEGAQLRRQARRYGRDVLGFALERMPALPCLRMDAKALHGRPLAAGRLVVNRGYRLLLGTMAPEGDAVLRRLRCRFPRRLAALSVPALEPAQIRQLSELMLMCIVPERLSPWDWLF